MQLIKIKRKKFTQPYGTYDISHNVSGTLAFNQPTVLQIQNTLFSGSGDYNLFNFEYLYINPDYSLKNILDIQVPSGYTAYPEISGSSLIAKVYSDSVVDKRAMQTIASGSLKIEGPVQLELDQNIFTQYTTYALFDLRTSDLSGSLGQIDVVFQTNTYNINKTPLFLYGPYVCMSTFN